MTKKVSNKKSKNSGEEEMSVFELSVLMLKQFERIDERFQRVDERFERQNEFNASVKENFEIVNLKISRMAEEQEKISQKLDKVNDKANNTFYLGQEFKCLEERVTKLDK